MCNPVCSNGGYCKSPNNCVCPVGYTGQGCEEGK